MLITKNLRWTKNHFSNSILSARLISILDFILRFSGSQRIRIWWRFQLDLAAANELLTRASLGSSTYAQAALDVGQLNTRPWRVKAVSMMRRRSDCRSVAIRKDE